MQTIPLQTVPSQSVKSVLGGQNVQIDIYQKTQGIFVNVISDEVEIVSGVLAHDAVGIVCREYTGFVGNLLFNDTQGRSDPTYDGLGTRFELLYLNDVEYDLIRK